MSAMSSLEAKIDDLYARPLADFTPTRNALAKTLSGTDAARVKRLAKPSVVPWAVNQVYWHARPMYDRVMKAGERLRHAQIAALQGKPADVRSASDAHRAAIAAAVKEAERFASDAGSHPGADALTRTFESLSLAPTPPAESGRLTEPLQPSGFEALAGITPVAHAGQLGRVGQTGRPAERGGHVARAGHASKERDDKEERARAARETAAARAHEAAIKKEEAALARAQAAERLAHEAWLRAQRDVDDIRQRLVRVKSEG
jgi:hypothetical protein